MRSRWAQWLAWAVLVAPGAHAQSLAEVAEKEKERRGKRDRSEPVRVIGDEELSRARSDERPPTGPETPTASEPVQVDDAGGKEPSPRAALSDGEVRYYRDAWNRVWAKQVAAAEKELEIAEYQAGQCQAAAHYVYVPIAIDCAGVRERLAVARFVLDDLRQNRFNWELLLPERSRAPPGAHESK